MDEPSSPEGTPITLRIKFKSASLDEFVARYGADVSAGGIFVRTKQPLAVGSLLHFDFSLADGSPLMAGFGTVVWIREADASRAGSIPGMGVRFDQLTPESQQTHQQILSVKVRRGGERPPAAPAQSLAPAPAARPAARPSPPALPVAARPAHPAPVAAQSAARPPEPSDEFESAGKTEIADRPPSFYFDSVDKARGVPPASARRAEEAAPRATLEDTSTDASRSEPIDINEDGDPMAGLITASGERASANQGRSSSSGDELAPASLELPLDGGAVPVPITERRPSGPIAAAEPAAAQNWLDRAMKMPDRGGASPSDPANAAPVETSAEHTEEMPAPPEAVQAEAAAPASGVADHPAFADMPELGQDVPDRPERKSGQSRTLIVVGVVAAALAFGGVYLLQTKPWQTPAAPASSPAAAVTPEPSPAAEPAVPKPVAPGQPAVQPTPAQAAPIKPAEKLPTPAPVAAPAPSKPQVAQAAKPVEPIETGKHTAPAAGAGRKAQGKTASVAASAPGATKSAETVYFVKVRSLPPGAQVLIDNEPMGQTPFQRRVLDINKAHTVTVRKPGYLPYESSVSLQGNWVKDGNTAITQVFARLKKTKTQAAEPSAAPASAPEPASEAQPAPATEQPEKL